MAIAGKVAITPGGEWSVDVAYDKLVVVTFGNNVYLSIKPSTGIEPTNEEYWMLLIENVTQEQYDNIINGTTTVGNANKLGGKSASEYALDTDLANYLQKDWDIATNFRVGNHNWTGAPSIRFEESDGTIQAYLSAGSNQFYRYAPNGTSYLMLDTGNYGDYAFPITGGTVTSASQTPITVQHTGGNNAFIKYQGVSSDVGSLGFADTNMPAFIANDGSYWHQLLHTGNKPTGTYTGNGSATSRDITTGGIGKACLVYSEKGAVFIDAKGGLGHTSGGTYKVFKYTETKKETNYLRVATTDELLNASGVEYTYQVM